MTAATLHICGEGETRCVTLNARGAVIGRSPQCDIVLHGNSVSRKHARIFRDPFKRWIIEDLNSHNGVNVGGERVQACALLPGEQVIIGSFKLILELPPTRQIEADRSVVISGCVTEDASQAQIVTDKVNTHEKLSDTYLKQLNDIHSRLLELTDPSRLYPEVCRCLASLPMMVAAVLRLPGEAVALPQCPEILACCLGGSPEGGAQSDMTNLCLSRRTLEAVRTTGDAVMAQSVHASEARFALTVSDSHNPRAVIAVPLGDLADVVDCLYFDLPLTGTSYGTFDFVRAVAREVGAMRQRLITAQMKAERQRLDEQLSLARDIQAKLTPTVPEGGFQVDLAVCYKPAMWVGGDYCDVWALENGRIAFAVGDVSGKGLAAAMMMSNLQAALRTTMTFCSDLSAVVEHINRHLCHSLRDDMFVTFFLGLFDPSENKISYVNAGHIPPLLMIPSESARSLGKAANPPLGILERPFAMNEQTMAPGASLLVMTDGIIEAKSPDGEMFTLGGVSRLMTEKKADSARQLVHGLTSAVADFRQTRGQHDDITVLALVNRRPPSDTAQ